MDHLSEIIDQISLQAGVFYTGKLCGLTHFNQQGSLEGHIHLLRSGTLSLLGEDKMRLVLNKPSIIFFPKPVKHGLQARDTDDAELICATVNYGTNSSNVLANSLPNQLILPLDSTPFLKTNIDWIMDEAKQEQHGRQAIMNRLMEVFIINLIRSLVNNGDIRQGMLAGLMHPQLKNVLQHLHNAPAEPWSLEKMSELALMSRSKFAAVFKEVVGATPNEYLANWRIGVAQSALKQGKSVSVVANAVGYETASALARVFRKQIRMSPKEWLEQNK